MKLANKENYELIIKLGVWSLQNLPRLRFNKEGNLLAVTTGDSGIKILANAAGMRSLRSVEAPPFEALRSAPEPAAIKVLFLSKCSTYFG